MNLLGVQTVKGKNNMCTMSCVWTLWNPPWLRSLRIIWRDIGWSINIMSTNNMESIGTSNKEVNEYTEYMNDLRVLRAGEIRTIYGFPIGEWCKFCVPLEYD